MTKVFKIRKNEVPYVETEVSVGQLAFYPENPRIYSQFAGSGDRTQENIQAKLEAMDHVRELRSQIDRGRSSQRASVLHTCASKVRIAWAVQAPGA